MRNFFLLIFFAIAQIAAAQNRGVPDTVQTAILSTIQAESEAFHNRNLDKWLENYLQKGDISWNWVGENGKVLEANSWEGLKGLITNYMKENSEPEKLDIRRENVQFIGGGRYVWVNFDEYQTIDKKTKHLKGVRLMVRWGRNSWKISALHTVFVGWK